MGRNERCGADGKSDAGRTVADRDSTGRQHRCPAAPARSAHVRMRASGLLPRKAAMLHEVVLASPRRHVALRDGHPVRHRAESEAAMDSLLGGIPPRSDGGLTTTSCCRANLLVEDPDALKDLRNAGRKSGGAHHSSNVANPPVAARMSESRLSPSGVPGRVQVPWPRMRCVGSRVRPACRGGDGYSERKELRVSGHAVSRRGAATHCFRA